MKTRSPDQVLDEIARESIGQDINLSSGLHAKIRKEVEKNMFTKRLLTAFFAVIVVLGILVSIPKVAQAMKRLLGYIPGAGVVEQSVPLRILSTPVETKTGNTTLRVDQVVVDSEHTALVYEVDNIPASGDESSQTEDYCHSLPWLQLSDGSWFEAKTITANNWSSGYTRQLEFATLPAGENSPRLVLPCFEGALKTAFALPVEVVFTLTPAPEGMTVYPIVELPTPTAQAATQASLATADQISLVINQYVQTDTQLILMGALKTDFQDFRLSLVEEADVHLQDASGSNILVTEDFSLTNSDSNIRNAQTWSLNYLVAGSYVPGQARLIVDRAWIGRTSEASFSFDPGANPQPGQTWVLNQDLEIDGHLIKIIDVTKSTKGEGLVFNYEAPAEITNISLLDLEHPLLGGGGGDSSTAFSYKEGFPTGVIKISVTGYDELVPGPWEAQVDLPAFKDGAQPTALPEACITASSWKNALLSSSRELPGEVGKNLIMDDPLEPDFLYHVLRADLTKGKAVDLGPGDDGSISPDGQTLIYATEDGLKFLSLSTGEIQTIPDTSRRDRGPLWSPDGTKIAFTRGPASGLIGAAGPHDLMLMDADGSNQKTLLSDNEGNFAQEWMPFSKVLLYTVRGPEGASVNTIQTETGKVNWLTDLNYQNASVTISPNGRQIAYEAMLPGEKYAIYTSSLDGSNARLIANADPAVITHPKWSPDGEWLAFSVYDPSLSEEVSYLGLVNLATCQITPLLDLHGYVTAWQ